MERALCFTMMEIVTKVTGKEIEGKDKELISGRVVPSTQGTTTIIKCMDMEHMIIKMVIGMKANMLMEEWMAMALSYGNLAACTQATGAMI